MERPVVLVTETEFAKGEAIFTAAGDLQCVAAPDAEDALADMVRRTAARFVIVGPLPYRDALYDALPAGGALVRFGVGYDGIDVARAARAGLLCANTPGVLDQTVAELTLLLMLAGARHLPSLDAGMRSGAWMPRRGTEISGRRLAVVGCGRIGRTVARIATDGFGMQVRCAGPRDDYRAAVHDADFVSLHIPATPGNVRYVNEARLAMIPRHAWLINTSRGAVVDEAALYDTLAAGRLAGAALDVYAREPYVPADPGRDLRTLSNVILTPHVGSDTPEAGSRIAERALHNVRCARDGDVAAMDRLVPASDAR